MRAPDLCPHCGQRMSMRAGVRLPPKLADLYDMIEHTSRYDGITLDALAWSLYGNEKTTIRAKHCVKANVLRLNEFLEETDLVVRRDYRHRFNGYKLVRR